MSANVIQIALYYTRGFTAQYVDDFDALDYDLGTLTKTIERLVMASAPLQAWWISSRELYRWEDPWRTARWFALFIFLWYTDHIIGFVYAYILYVVIREGLFPSTIDSVRDSLDRTFNQSTKARAWGELVETYGRDGWVEPLLDQVGPQLMLQLEDLADFCEVIQKSVSLACSLALANRFIAFTDGLHLTKQQQPCFSSPAVSL